MVLVDSDLQLVKSAHTVNNISSLGGEMTDIEISESLDSLWDQINNSELSSSVVGEYEVRCIYVRNKSLNNEVMRQCQVWIEQNTTAPFTDIDIGIGNAQTGDIEQTVASEDILPQNIAWTFARGEENAEFIGDLDTEKGKSIWIRRHAGPAKSGSSYPSDNYILRFKFLRSGPIGPPPPGPGPPPGPDPGLDPFGIRMIYKTQTSGDVSSPFYMNMNDPYSDCRFNTNTGMVAAKNGDGSWALGASPRIRLYTSLPGCARDIYDVPLDTYDHDVWGQRGYMKAPNDWKNVEITGYFKVASVDPANLSERKLYLYSRTFRHNTGVAGGCSGTAYKGVIYGSDQVLKFHKESFHDGSQPCGDRSIITVTEGIPRTDNNSWFGFKVVMWNYPDPARPSVAFVHLEIWLDLSNTNIWTKMAEKNDTGGWYPGMPSTTCPGDENCGGHQDQIIKWGGPTTELRWDAGYTKVDFKNLSCREIIPGTSVSPPPPPPTPPPPGPGPSPPPPPPGPGPPPPPPPPGPGTDVFGITQIYASKSGGSSWAATTWDNGTSRQIDRNPSDSASTCYPDPHDSRFRMVGTGDGRVIINGTEIMKATMNSGLTGSPRVTVSGTWRNVEQTIYVKCPSAGMLANFDLRPRSDHYCAGMGDDGFGGYIINADFETQQVGLRKEKTHAIGYGPRKNIVPVTLAANTWYGFKGICYNVGTGVKLEAYMDTTNGENGGNWVKITEGADDGSWLGTPDQGSNTGSAIRSNLNNDNQFLEYKWWTSREIDTSVVPSPPPPPGPPPPPPPGPSPPPPPPPPPGTGPIDPFGVLMLNETKAGGRSWFSTAWAANDSRLLNTGNVDPFDSRLQYIADNPTTTQVEISGVPPGELVSDDFNEGCRLLVKDTWLNTEMTIYQWRDTTDGPTELQLRSRSRHETSCSFGAYVVNFRDSTGNTVGESQDKLASVQVEPLHPKTIEHLSENPLTAGIPKSQWVGFKTVTRSLTSSAYVKVEGYINYDITKQTPADWVKVTEYFFTSSNTNIPADWATDPAITACNGLGDGQADKILAGDKNCFKYLTTGNICWIQSNNATKVKWKFYSVREINPLG